MFIIILGDYRSGKTLRLVIEGFDSYINSDKEIWGNLDLDLPNYRKITPMDLLEIGENKLLLLDEMQTFVESRRSMSRENLFITNIFDSVDKRDCIVIGTAHLFSSIDIRFRLNVHRIIKCERIGKRKREWKRIEDLRDFRFSVLNMYSGEVKKEILLYEKAEPYFKIYNTQEKIYYPNQRDFELSLLLNNNPKLGYERLMEIAHKIMAKKSKITHPSVKVGLLQLGYTTEFESLVYSCIKDFSISQYKGGIKESKILNSNKKRIITEYPL